MKPSVRIRSRLELGHLEQFYRSVREATRALCANLSDADATVQSMADASPAKWHLAHTAWFFEEIVLRPHLPAYQVFDEQYGFLFNSYYESAGARLARSARGMLTQPTLETIHAYREHVDEAVARLLRREPSADVAQLIELGCHHEQQHQELLLTDILNLFASNPVRPAFKSPEPLGVKHFPVTPPQFAEFPGGLVTIGHAGQGFAFDCEGPAHSVFLEPYRLCDRLVTNREWIEFMDDGGYRNPLLWLSDGWAMAQRAAWDRPLYWECRDGEHWSMTLRGVQPVALDAPVTHVSYYEAVAYAAWAGCRLPTEAEWEHAAAGYPVRGNFADSGRLRPAPAQAMPGLRQMFGDVWEWTSSAFAAYPRFRPTGGAVAEYNGKFMSGQFVLRGGSCVTPAGHVRRSYRNFFAPAARWQFSGVRLAADAPGSRHRPVRGAPDALRADVTEGLAKTHKAIPSRWLYDRRGSELFEEITQLAEYYPTRAETEILRDNLAEIAGFCGEGVTLLEYGAGAGIKTELLVSSLGPRFYLPIDIDGDFLEETVKRFRTAFPEVATVPLVADFAAAFALPDWLPGGRRVAFFPGSTIGNLNEAEACAFLRRVRTDVTATGKAIIGVDLRKSLDVLTAAYDDAQGVTALFNRNLLTRLNRELNATFDLDAFRHRVIWNEEASAIEMHLESLIDQRVQVAGCEYHFSAGETIHTESSRKYEVGGFTSLCERNHWRVERLWLDRAGRFALFGLA